MADDENTVRDVEWFALTNPAPIGAYGTYYWVCPCTSFRAIRNGHACPECGLPRRDIKFMPDLSDRVIALLSDLHKLTGYWRHKTPEADQCANELERVVSIWLTR